MMWLAAAMMLVEIAAGTVFGSMALLADGWHMSSHVLALGVSAAAYALARRHADDPRFTFGTWKIEVLGGYTCAVLLPGVAAYMGIESVQRLVQPSAIQFNEALAGGKYFGAAWLDPVMGLAGTALVGRWAPGLLRDTGHALLDAEMDSAVVRDVWDVLRSMPPPTELRDLHVWRVGKGKYACIVSVATDGAVTADDIRERLSAHEELVHVTVEVASLRS